MNVFYLDPDPAQCVKCMFDRHVVKMQLETTQILSTVIRQSGTLIPYGTVVYKSTHSHHPSVLWAGSSGSNFRYLRSLVLLMEEERRYRFRSGPSKTLVVLNQLPVPPLPEIGFTRPPRVMPASIRRKLGDAHDESDVVMAYRIYYCLYKRHLATWSRRSCPDWWVRSSLQAQLARLSSSQNPFDFLNLYPES